MHEARLMYPTLAPTEFQALLHFSGAVQRGSLGRDLVDLVFLRVSQINGCAYCVDMHWRDLVGRGHDPRHLNLVSVWRESPFLDDRQRAALGWAEHLTAIPQRVPTDADFAEARKHLTEAELAELGFAVVVIHAWNRLNVGFSMPVPVTVP